MFSYISFRYVSTHFHEFPMKLSILSNDFLWFSMNFPWISHEFPRFSYGFPMVFLWFSMNLPYSFPWNFYTSMAKDATGRSKTARVHSLVTWYQQTLWFCFIWFLYGFMWFYSPKTGVLYGFICFFWDLEPTNMWFYWVIKSFYWETDDQTCDLGWHYFQTNPNLVRTGDFLWTVERKWFYSPCWEPKNRRPRRIWELWTSLNGVLSYGCIHIPPKYRIAFPHHVIGRRNSWWLHSSLALGNPPKL